MNDERPIEQLGDQRLARELRRAAQGLDLPTGSEIAVVARGRQRQRRRRQGVSLLAVSALGAGTAVVVQQLARNGDASLSIGSSDGATALDDTSLADVAPAATTVGDTIGATPAPEIVPARVVPSNMTWRVVEPDSAAAVSFVGGGPGVHVVPGIMLSTAPGASDDYEPMWWSSEDGITWQPFELELPVGTPGNVVFDVGNIYTVGTAPGVAAGGPNPLRVAVSADGVTWDEVDLGIDIDSVAERNLPFVLAAGTGSQVVPVDDGAVVLVDRQVLLDVPAVIELAGVDPAVASQVTTSPAGLQIPVDPTCVDRPNQDLALTSTTMVVGAEYGVAPASVAESSDTLPVVPPPTTGPATPDDGSSTDTAVAATITTTTTLPAAPPATEAAEPASPLSTIPALSPNADECERALHTWEEVGVPAEVIDVITRPRTLAFHVVDGVATEVAVPGSMRDGGGLWAEQLPGSPARFVGSTLDGVEAFVFVDGSFVATGEMAANTDSLIGVNATTRFAHRPAMDGIFPYFGLNEGLIVAEPVDRSGPAVSADWSQVLGEGRFGQWWNQTVTSAGFVRVGPSYADLTAESGGRSVEVDGVVFSRASLTAPVEVQVAATGEPIDPSALNVDPENGTIELTLEAGSDPIRIGFGQLSPVLSDESSVDYDNPSWMVATSANGVDVAVESIAELLGMSDADISSVPRISTDGTSTILAVTLKERNAEGVPRQLVLVGTPDA